jgi:transposase-like protein
MKNVCPECRATESYQLADGRRQCKACRRKFSPGTRKMKLSDAVQEQLKIAFWEMQPAEAVARELKINRKTVLKKYLEFRQGLAASNHLQRKRLEKDLSRNQPVRILSLYSKPGEHPMFYLADLGKVVGMYPAQEFVQFAQMLHAGEVSVMMVYRKDEGGGQLEPESIFRRQLWPENGDQRCRECLEFMLETIKVYRGIPADKVQLYVEEMLFRYNCRDRDRALKCLGSAGESSRIGDELKEGMEEVR